MGLSGNETIHTPCADTLHCQQGWGPHPAAVCGHPALPAGVGATPSRCVLTPCIASRGGGHTQPLCADTLHCQQGWGPHPAAVC